MPTKRPAAAALAGMLCLATAACGASPSPAADAATGPSAPGYPVTLDNCGRTTTYTKAPSRVVVMNGASVAEVSSLLALGLGDRIVANGQSYGRSEVPGRAEAIKKLPTGGVTPNDAYDVPREAMLGLKPDLVLSTTSYGFDAKNGFATRDDLKAVGANAYVSPQGCDQDTSRMTIEDSHRLLRDLGKIFNVPDRAERIIAESRRRIADVSAKVAEAKKAEDSKGPKAAKDSKGGGTPNVMVVFSNMSMGGNDFSAVAARGIWNDVLARAGGRNAFASASASKTTFADLSKEAVAAERVDALVVISYNDPDPEAYARKLLKEFPQWPAAKNKRSLVLSDSIYLGPSNHLAVERIARMLHPDAFASAPDASRPAPAGTNG
ncbi:MULTISPECIES: ABC transporter substrate-binding protein [Streptomyces]|uniref:ABC transporter substrate-binding protein n=1 Tax=Streptomyces sudanensis TaxID=436397 RepID=A0ABY4TAB3_9ACTN|nr:MULTISPECIES: ABC transporter substrate-binding protein [Streptomyces]URN14984.1 ABC transporter substrate-binding protein [Streptomyces sudanensis]